MTLDNNLKLAENAVLSVEESLSKVFQERSNQVFQKLENILTIFKEEKVSTSHFNQSSGSGHDDISREKIDAVFARLFLAEKAAVRMQFVSGTHAISSVLFGILRPGDVMLSLTGQPYDTLEEVIGIRGGGRGSLKAEASDALSVHFCQNKAWRSCKIQVMEAYAVNKSARRERFAEVIAGIRDYTAEELDGELLDLYEASKKLSFFQGRGPNAFLAELRNLASEK